MNWWGIAGNALFDPLGQKNGLFDCLECDTNKLIQDSVVDKLSTDVVTR